MKAGSEAKRMQFVFDKAAMAQLRRLEAATGAMSMAEVVRDAMSFYEWAVLETQAGRFVATVDHDANRVREVMFPFQLRARARQP